MGELSHGREVSQPLLQEGERIGLHTGHHRRPLGIVTQHEAHHDEDLIDIEAVEAP